ncbi:MAG: hypothetical protein J7L64_02635 [Acidobacteria bacterium]|nr:hypothetical protein [Acidobacteriota bacterium]
MKEIKEAIYGKLVADETLRVLLGASAEDPRIYYYFPPGEIGLSSSAPAYITYYELSSASPFIEREEEVYAIDIWACTLSVLEDVFSRVDGLLNRRFLSLPSYYHLLTVREFKRDLFEPERGLYHKVVHYRVIFIRKE